MTTWYRQQNLLSGAVPMELEITDVTKNYRGGKTGVADVSMRIGPGVLGLVGPNGAGKSTLMRILATVSRPTYGMVRWNGRDIVGSPDELRHELGYLPQDFGVYPHLSAREFLSYLAAVKGLSRRSARARIDELLAMVNLTDAGNRPLGKYSGGMRQRVGIAQALLNDPRLLIVDEPTVGLDPEERVRFRNMLGELAADRIVILSTHIVTDVEAVADQIAIMMDGRLRLRTSPEQLLSSMRGQVWDVVVDSAALPELRSRFVVGRTTRTSHGVRVRVLSPTAPGVDAMGAEPELEDAYLGCVRELATSGGARVR